MAWDERDPELDYLLSMALEWHDDVLLCPCKCGHYAVDTLDDDADGWYEVDDSTICNARAAMDDYQRETKGEIEPGMLLRIVDAREKAPSRQQKHPDQRHVPASTVRTKPDEALA